MIFMEWKLLPREGIIKKEKGSGKLERAKRRRGYDKGKQILKRRNWVIEISTFPCLSNLY